MPVQQSFPAAASDTSRLVRRVTMGVSSQEVARAASLGYEQYLDYQLDYLHIDDREAEAFVANRYPMLAQPPLEIASHPQPTIIQTLQEATLYRAAFSRRQLYQRMVEFWTDHFNVNIEKVGFNKVEDDREVIRRHALGSFRDLLKATTTSIAMLGNLDQFENSAESPNQNYARELMELHTIGVNGGYTQHDVIELTRVFTGWTFERQYGGKFMFDPAIHDWGAKGVMTIAVPAGAGGSAGIKEGEELVERLLAHPSTGRFLATKLLRWLLTPTPSETQIAAVADVYHKTNGDIRAMIRMALSRDWLRDAPYKFKRPVHYVTSMLRAVAPRVTGMTVANSYLFETGQELLKWDQPDGYPDAMEFWEGGLLSRWRVANQFMSASGPELAVDVARYVARGPDEAVALVDRELFASELVPRTREALTGYARRARWSEARARETLALALSTPAFQWY